MLTFSSLVLQVRTLSVHVLGALELWAQILDTVRDLGLSSI